MKRESGRQKRRYSDTFVQFEILRQRYPKQIQIQIRIQVQMQIKIHAKAIRVLTTAIFDMLRIQIRADCPFFFLVFSLWLIWKRTGRKQSPIKKPTKGRSENPKQKSANRSQRKVEAVKERIIYINKNSMGKKKRVEKVLKG